MRQKIGGTFGWGRVSEANMRDLSEKMVDAAQVPPNIRQDYWTSFGCMTNALAP